MQGSILEKLADTQPLKAIGEHGPVIPGSPLWRQIRGLIDSADRANPFVNELRALDREKSFFPLGSGFRLVVLGQEFEQRRTLIPKGASPDSPLFTIVAEAVRNRKSDVWLNDRTAEVLKRFDQIDREISLLLKSGVKEPELLALADWRNPQRFSHKIEFTGDQFAISIAERRNGAPSFVHVPDRELLSKYCYSEMSGGCAISTQPQRFDRIAAPNFSDRRVMLHELAHHRGYGEIGARLFSEETRTKEEALVNVTTSEVYNKRETVFSILEAYEGRLYDRKAFTLIPEVRAWFDGGASYNTHIKPGIDSNRRLAQNDPKLSNRFEDYLNRKLFITGDQKEFVKLVDDYFKQRRQLVILHPELGQTPPTESTEGFLKAMQNAGLIK